MTERSSNNGGAVDGWVPPQFGYMTFSEAMGYVRTIINKHMNESPEIEVIDLRVYREPTGDLWAYTYRYREKGPEWTTKVMLSIGATGFGQPTDPNPILFVEPGDKSEE